MDANDDVELVANRPYRDNDEVYPAEDLYEDEPVFKPAARRQNRCFACGIVGFVAFLCLAGLFLFVAPAENANPDAKTLDTNSLAADEHGTVSNNAENAHAKVKEVMDAKANGQQKKPNKKNHAVQAISQAQSTDAPTAAAAGEDVAAKESTTTVSGEESTTNVSGEEEQTNPPKNDDKNTKSDFSAWHEVKVTLDDGVMYEIVEVLEHDPNSFT